VRGNGWGRFLFKMVNKNVAYKPSVLGTGNIQEQVTPTQQVVTTSTGLLNNIKSYPNPMTTTGQATGSFTHSHKITIAREKILTISYSTSWATSGMYGWLVSSATMDIYLNSVLLISGVTIQADLLEHYISLFDNYSATDAIELRFDFNIAGAATNPTFGATVQTSIRINTIY
jgi:hypothetical protein